MEKYAIMVVDGDIMNENNLTDAEKIREYFRSFLEMYISAAEKAKLPVDKERLQQIIDNAEFKTFEMPNSTGTFSVNRNLIQVIMNNFRKNGSDRNNFLLLHEFTHLDSSVNEELFADQNALLQKLNEQAEKLNGKYITGINAYYGIIAIDEVLAQWTGEELNDALKEKKREVHEFTRGPLDSDMKFKSDFSDNDIYSPLEPVVEKLLQSIGYKDIREFATDVLASDKGVVDSIQGKDFEKLCQIGVICKAIYKENGFNDTLSVSKEDVEQAYSSLFKDTDFGENNGGDERI